MKLWASTDLYGDNQIQVCLSEPDGRFGYGLEEIEVRDQVEKGDWVYMVIVTYQSGGTFQTTHGNKAFGGLELVADDAFNLAQAIRNHEQYINSSEYRSQPHAFEDKYYMDWKGERKYVGAWTGYFEGIENVDVVRVAVGA